jgi:hypothetical protein
LCVPTQDASDTDVGHVVHAGFKLPKSQQFIAALLFAPVADTQLLRPYDVMRIRPFLVFTQAVGT